MKAALINAALVGSGGFLGALARYALSGWVQRQLPAGAFPYGTLVVNIVGCLAIGVMAGLLESRQPFSAEVRAFVVIGLLGGFTTFSTFGYEALALIRGAELVRAGLYVGGHVVVGVACVWLGYAVTAVDPG